jgi:hypothetical protein
MVLLEALSWVLREIHSRTAQSWPTVPGVVESAEVRKEGAGSYQSYAPEVSYSYTVGGEYYTGFHIVNSEKRLRAFPKGSRVLVHYRNSDPTKSFLDREDLRSRKKMAQSQ